MVLRFTAKLDKLIVFTNVLSYFSFNQRNCYLISYFISLTYNMCYHIFIKIVVWVQEKNDTLIKYCISILLLFFEPILLQLDVNSFLTSFLTKIVASTFIFQNKKKRKHLLKLKTAYLIKIYHVTGNVHF